MSTDVAVQPATNRKAVASFILALAAVGIWVVSTIPAVVALVLSILLAGLAVRDRRHLDPERRGWGLAGWSVALNFLGMVIFLAIIPGIQHARDTVNRMDTA